MTADEFAAVPGLPAVDELMDIELSPEGLMRPI